MKDLCAFKDPEVEGRPFAPHRSFYGYSCAECQVVFVSKYSSNISNSIGGGGEISSSSGSGRNISSQLMLSELVPTKENGFHACIDCFGKNLGCRYALCGECFHLKQRLQDDDDNNNDNDGNGKHGRRSRRLCRSRRRVS